MNIWDIAAGILILKEAGGLINEIDITSSKNIKIIATNTNINSKLLEKLHNFFNCFSIFFCYKADYEKKHTS